MKSIIKKIITVGLVSTTLLGLSFTDGLKALALTKEEIVQKLGLIPVYTIADAQGAPLVAVGNNQDKVTGVFISQQDAQAFIKKLQTDNPDLAKQVKVVPVSLAEVYELSLENEKNKNGLTFAYVPIESEVESAKVILTQAGEKYQGGVPLFVARTGDDQGYLILKQDNKEVIPFFFQKEQLQEVLEQVKKEKPDLAAQIKVEVILLEGLINALRQSNDQALNQIVLWPTRESIDFLRSTLPQNNQNNPTNQNNQKK